VNPRQPQPLLLLTASVLDAGPVDRFVSRSTRASDPESLRRLVAAAFLAHGGPPAVVTDRRVSPGAARGAGRRPAGTAARGGRRHGPVKSAT
jgi:hypothetical protein